MEVQYEIRGGDFSAAGQASSEIKKLLKQFNIDPQIVRRIAIALFEAEVNVVAHAYKGIMKADIDTDSIRVTVEDEGPGIEDIDKAMKMGAGWPMGPFTLCDMVGIDIALEVCNTLYSETGDSKYRPALVLKQYVRAGWLGRKTGRGWYDYSAKK